MQHADFELLIYKIKFPNLNIFIVEKNKKCCNCKVKLGICGISLSTDNSASLSMGVTSLAISSTFPPYID